MREKDLSVLISGAGGAAGINTIKSLRLAKFKGKITAIDSFLYSPGFFLADNYYVVPKAESKNYIKTLYKIIKKNNINLILPTSGFDIFPISKIKKDLESKNIIVFMNDYQTVNTCINKLKAYQQLKKVVPVPTLYKSITEVGMFPVFIKPVKGKGSENCYICNDKNEYESYIRIFKKIDFVIQEYLPGKEYTVDVLSDLDKNVVVAVCRQRIKTDSGISVTGQIVSLPNLESASAEVCVSLGIRGPSCIQFKEDSRGNPKFTEINPRLGGGTIISTLAGVNLPKIILDIILKRPMQIPKPKNIIITRYLDEIEVKKPK